MSSDRIGGDLLLDPELEALSAKCQRMTLRGGRAVAEAWRIARALERARGDRTKAARLLGIERRKLDKRMSMLCIRPSGDGLETVKKGSRLRLVARAPAGRTNARTRSAARAPD
jgi:hypothetical protein